MGFIKIVVNNSLETSWLPVPTSSTNSMLSTCGVYAPRSIFKVFVTANIFFSRHKYNDYRTCEIIREEIFNSLAPVATECFRLLVYDHFHCYCFLLLVALLIVIETF